MVIFFNCQQFSNALLPIVVTPSGIITDVSSLQFLNASAPIFVTLFGIFIDVSFIQ